MDQKNHGQCLIFLIGPPRSGTTLLQSILGTHPRILTLPEPWIMLHPVYAMRDKGIMTEFNSDYAYHALKKFLGSGSNSHETWLNAVRNYALTLYQSKLSQTGKAYFLDKSTRYYFIIPELQEIFPKAKFIFLIRHPLAIFSSRLTHSLEGKWWKMRDRGIYNDLVNALKLIIENKNRYQTNTLCIKYEHLVSNPEDVLTGLCDFLDIEYDEKMIQYKNLGEPTQKIYMGDTRSIHKHDRPIDSYIERWRKDLDSPIRRQIARDFLLKIGKEIFHTLGYDFEESLKELGAPNALEKILIPNMKRLLNPDQKASFADKILLNSARLYGLFARGKRN